MGVISIVGPRGERTIGPGSPAFLIAELSGNHKQDLGRALALVDAAAETGVDAVKLQTYTPDTLTIDCDKSYFQVDVGSDAWDGMTLHQLYGTAYTPWEWHAELKERAEKLGLIVFSSPFDETAVTFLEELDMPLHKVASFEIGDLPLLRSIAATGKPVILSRGLASEPEIRRAVETLRANGAGELAVLQCVSSYPADPRNINLRTIPDIARRFDVISGLSDHTLGSSVAVASVALGAAVIEKHLTLARADGGPDAAFSLEPDEFRRLVDDVRVAEQALGRPTYEISPAEAANRAFRRSVFVVRDIRAGETLTRENIRIIRPGQGLDPRHYDELLGRTAACDVERGEPLSVEMVEGFAPEP